MNTFNKNLTFFRKQKGISQSQLAKLINTTHRMIAYYENETTSIPLEKINKLAEILNISPSDLVTPIENNKNLIDTNNTDIRIFKKIKEIEKLSERDQRAILNHIDALIFKRKFLSKKEKSKQFTETKN